MSDIPIGMDAGTSTIEYAAFSRSTSPRAMHRNPSGQQLEKLRTVGSCR